ncbi:uncharacterized protein PRCAT00002109001 [Priceomyces carsonii]|uniref:uncharacterized protein n=1 Tax=Priceomyces carsonii TaxID=28549 RepID=UPI002EDABDBF|nr:unnamed protein product [Priceomyces carsonii]
MKLFNYIYFALLLFGTQVTAYNEATYNFVHEMIDYCSVSYCIKDFGNLYTDSGPALKAGQFPDVCPTVIFCTEHPNIEIVHVYTSDIAKLQLSGTGYIAVDHTKN